VTCLAVCILQNPLREQGAVLPLVVQPYRPALL